MQYPPLENTGVSGDTLFRLTVAYDYRSFGEQVVLSEPADKVTENFTGKELDDETVPNYFGARYLDPIDADATYIDNYSGQIECQITGKFNGNSSPAQNLLHEMVSHGIPIMLDDRDSTASAVEEEQKAVDGVFPVDVPDHIIDRRYEE